LGRCSRESSEHVLGKLLGLLKTRYVDNVVLIGGNAKYVAERVGNFVLGDGVGAQINRINLSALSIDEVNSGGRTGVFKVRVLIEPVTGRIKSFEGLRCNGELEKALLWTVPNNILTIWTEFEVGEVVGEG